MGRGNEDGEEGRFVEMGEGGERGREEHGEVQ